MADRSTAAVGVANEGSEGPLSARQGGTTPDGTTTDDQINGTAEDHTAQERPEAEPPGVTPAAPTSQETEPIAVSGTAGRPAQAAGATSAVMAAAGDADDEAGSDGPDTADAAEDAADDAESSEEPADAADPDDKPGDEARTRPAPVTDTDRESAEVPAKEPTAEPAEPAEEPAAQADTPAGKPAADKAPARSTPARTVMAAPDLHSGHKLARRYQLAECVTRVDGFSSWRALDEKLRRAVGIHVLPADHPQARPVLAAARSAALLGDPRFVQVLDAVEEDDLVYVIHEWLPDAASLADLLASGPLEPHEAYQMVSQVSQGMAAAHREGLSHLRLDPGAVLRTVSGQYRIRGLAVAAALRGLKSERPQRQDTEAIGALLYAALTQRWPYEDDAHGLAGLPPGIGLIAPDQVRAGIHRGLSEVAMRALVNEGATASREEPPCTTPEELAKAVAAIPRIRPPEQTPPAYRVPPFQQPPKPPSGATRQPVPPPAPPPALPGRTGQVLKWAVAALVIVAIGLGSWQLADTLQSRGGRSADPTPTSQKGNSPNAHPSTGPIPILSAQYFDPYGNGSGGSPAKLKLAYDGNTSTNWETSWYGGAHLGNLKPGVGLILDLGSAKDIGNVKVQFEGQTSVDLLAAPSSASSAPRNFDAYTKVASGTGADVTLTPSHATTSRYLVVWLTTLPPTSDGHFRGRVSEINVTS